MIDLHINHIGNLSVPPFSIKLYLRINTWYRLVRTLDNCRIKQENLNQMMAKPYILQTKIYQITKTKNCTKLFASFSLLIYRLCLIYAGSNSQGLHQQMLKHVILRKILHTLNWDFKY
jgi:hypothetical protein